MLDDPVGSGDWNMEGGFVYNNNSPVKERSRTLKSQSDGANRGKNIRAFGGCKVAKEAELEDMWFETGYLGSMNDGIKSFELFGGVHCYDFWPRFSL